MYLLRYFWILLQVTLKGSTPACEYGEKLQQLFSKINVLHKALKVSYFMQGLNRKTREMIANSKENLKTFDAALEAAASYESTACSSYAIKKDTMTSIVQLQKKL
ncbi:hypothetical protein HMI54_007908 [Coelomomyces lativittatus]|nr:hypothetical protein HMI54_007908 [Coelomomyces lativittatus]